GGYERKPDTAVLLKPLEAGCVPAVDGGAPFRECLGRFQLGTEKGRVKLAHGEGGAGVDPAVARHLAAAKQSAVGGAIVHGGGTRPQGRVGDAEGAALAAVDVLGLVEAETAEIAESPGGTAAIRRADGERGVLDDR